MCNNDLLNKLLNAVYEKEITKEDFLNFFEMVYNDNFEPFISSDFKVYITLLNTPNLKRYWEMYENSKN